MSESFRITDMSYNFQLLLGFYGKVEWPLTSVTKKEWAQYNQDGLPIKQISVTIDPIDICFYMVIDSASNQRQKSVFPLIINTYDGTPPIYTTSYTFDKRQSNIISLDGHLDSWEDDNDHKGWVDINQQVGTMINKDTGCERGIIGGYPVQRVECTVHVSQGGTEVFKGTKTIYNNSYPADIKASQYQIRPAKQTIVFDEIVRLAVNNDHWMSQGPLDAKIKWFIPEGYRAYLKFVGAVDQYGYGLDDMRTVQVQALHTAGKAAVLAYCDAFDEELNPLTCYVDIISDQVQFESHVIEAPIVGCSLSTPQLYVQTNIGYQVFKNSLKEPKKLDAVQVCAVMQNTFAAGMYMNGGGDFPITMNDCDMSNLKFTLVDSNYHPIKLFNPLYMIIKVEPVKDPVEDISQWNGKLPINVPSIFQQQVMAQQQLLAQQIQQRQQQQVQQRQQQAFVPLYQQPPYQIENYVPYVDYSVMEAESEMNRLWAFTTTTGIL
jgi:hypothetical protein